MSLLSCTYVLKSTVDPLQTPYYVVTIIDTIHLWIRRYCGNALLTESGCVTNNHADAICDRGEYS